MCEKYFGQDCDYELGPHTNSGSALLSPHTLPLHAGHSSFYLYVKNMSKQQSKKIVMKTRKVVGFDTAKLPINGPQSAIRNPQSTIHYLRSTVADSLAAATGHLRCPFNLLAKVYSAVGNAIHICVCVCLCVSKCVC